MPKPSIDSNHTVTSGCKAEIRSATRAARRFRPVRVGVALLWSALASAQEMEPRAYSAAPVGTNFVVFDYARSSGGFSVDPSLPIANVQAKINTYAFGYSHSFGVAGHTASVAVSVPYASANVTGDVEGRPEHAYRSGLGDVRFRVALNLLGDPALTPEEFARRKPSTVLGVSVSVVAPTGQYVPSRLINVGSNRWSFKPEIGLSQPIGNWFVEGAAGAWFFTDNNDFFGGRRRSQDPIPEFQLHGGYTWRPGLWLAADATYFTGGRTSVNGAQDQDLQRSVRYGVTLSVPLTEKWSAKLAWSRGLITRVGGNFQTVSVALQYRWFNR
ncbi:MULTISPECIES: transporter [Paraburkholderia]|uniref:transporter n=1 Tax=Paraburkholderia TaxID=1822464 RepID=UPI0027E001CD|nr:transporter [Paraburkholderia madseniana]